MPALVAIAELLAARPGLAPGAAHALRAALNLDQAIWSPDHLEETADVLLQRSELPHLVFALAVTTAAGSRSAWTAQWRKRLDRLRGDDNLDIAEAALDVHYLAE